MVLLQFDIIPNIYSNSFTGFLLPKKECVNYSGWYSIFSTNRSQLTSPTLSFITAQHKSIGPSKPYFFIVPRPLCALQTLKSSQLLKEVYLKSHHHFLILPVFQETYQALPLWWDVLWLQSIRISPTSKFPWKNKNGEKFMCVSPDSGCVHSSLELSFAV